MEVFCKKSVLKNVASFAGKHLTKTLFFNKAAGLRRYILRNFQKHLFYSKPQGDCF